MPEGHTIYRLAVDIARDLQGELVQASSPQGRFADASELDGQRLTGSEAIGKHLFLLFDELRLHIHLGLFGKFKQRKAGEEPKSTVRLRLATERAAWDLTGPTACHLLDEQAFTALKARLGADPLAKGARPAQTWRRVHASRRALGALLLDQSIFAGIGNVYRAELLFLAGVHPETPGNELPRAKFEMIWRLAKELLAKGVEANKIITVPKEERTGRTASRARLYVYKQSHCRRCHTEIARDSLANRTIYWCPECQPRSDVADQP